MNTRWIRVWLLITALCLLLVWIFADSQPPGSKILFGYYIAVSLASGVLYCWDKLISPSASGDERVPEYLFLLTGVAGAAPALVVLSLLIRHKIRKRRFQALLLFMTMLHGLVLLSFSNKGAM